MSERQNKGEGQGRKNKGEGQGRQRKGEGQGKRQMDTESKGADTTGQLGLIRVAQLIGRDTNTSRADRSGSTHR